MKENPVLCPDGMYRWAYELNLYRNPVVLWTLYKVFGLIFGIMWLLIGVISCGDYGFWWKGFADHTLLFVLITAGMLLLCTISYFIYALIMGGKYCVLFEMNEQGIRHTQTAKQVEKAQIVSAIAIFAGLMEKQPGITAAGILSGARNSMYSDFKRVRTVRACPKQNTIKVNAPMNKNQIYAGDEDFDFVLEYIRKYTVNRKDRKERV